ncbi:MAG: 50S ribosome-binding GTPase [bacterium]|nr:50S ribosome-binding GTPase [bacterium]
MPANLPPQYYEAERRLKSAEGPLEKIEILRTMLAIMPHHKGTDKLQADIRAKIARLNKEMQKKHVISRYTYYIEKEGAAQCLLIGLPNSGKSQLLSVLTRATPEVAPYPFTTTKPIVGMMPFENIQIQLVDTPAINHEFMKKWLKNLMTSANLILLIVDLSDNNIIDGLDLIMKGLEEKMIKILAPTLSDIGYIHKKVLIVGNKKDLQNTAANFDYLRLHLLNKNFGTILPIVAVSAETKEGLQELKSQIYKSLDIIRVYSKEPGEKPDLTDPIVLSKGSTVIDAAIAIHKDFANKLKYARLWGSNKFDGQRVERNYLLKDGDIIEFHI